MKTSSDIKDPLSQRLALTVIVFGLVGGVAFDILVPRVYPGLGLVVFATLLGGAVVATRRPSVNIALLLICSWSLVAWSLVRSADYLVVLNVIGALVLLSAAVCQYAIGEVLWVNRVRHLFKVWAVQIGTAFSGLYHATAVSTRAVTSSNSIRFLPYLRGLLLTIPVIAIFIALLVSADAVFKDMLGDWVPDWDSERVASHLGWAALAGWIIGGLLTSVATQGERRRRPARTVNPGLARWPEPVAGGRPIDPSAEQELLLAEKAVMNPKQSDQPGPMVAWSAWRIGPTEILIMLGSVTALFTLFVIVQFAYLFNGADQLQLPGVTYAEYARKGFGELLAVATLTVGLVWVSMRVITQTGRAQLAFNILSTVLGLCSAVMVASALKRLGLYEEAFGYTRARILGETFTWLVAGVMAALVAQVWLRRRGLLVAGGVIIAFISLTVLNALNPDAMIATRNIEQAQKGNPLDVRYLSTLSADATPTILKRASAFARSAPKPPAAWNYKFDRGRHWYCAAVFDVSYDGYSLRWKRRYSYTDHSWRGWNIARRRANSAIEAHPELNRCPGSSSSTSGGWD